MEGPAITPLPFRRELPRIKYTCPACRQGKPEHAEEHTQDPMNCKYPPCRACKYRRHIDHKDHTRIEGECKVAGIPRIRWRCPGCQRELKRGEGHNDPEDDPGSCRFHGIDPRERGRPRQGAHPRYPHGREENTSTTTCSYSRRMSHRLVQV